MSEALICRPQVREFHRWVPPPCPPSTVSDGWSPLRVTGLDASSDEEKRRQAVLTWGRVGGVLVLSYDLYRLLILPPTNASQAQDKVRVNREEWAVHNDALLS